MSTFQTKCHSCGRLYEAERSRSQYCSGACRQAAHRRRTARDREFLAEFRSQIGSILARAEQATDPDDLQALGAAVAALTPEAFARFQ